MSTNNSPWPTNWRERTTVMGVINVTPDSFSDGGLYSKPEHALKLAGEYLNEGADLLDIGAQSTRPGSSEVDSEEELKRLNPVLTLIRKEYPNALISVDTFSSVVAKTALNLGSDWINDVTAGRRDPELLNVVADYKCPYVLTHSRGNSKNMEELSTYDDLIKDLKNELEEQTEKALKAGISKKKIIWDPGLGFAKNNKQNIQILQELESFTNSEFPILVGPSRKRFIGSVLDQPDPQNRLWGTAAVICRCAQAKVDMVRVHDVSPIVQSIKMTECILPKNNFS